MAARFTIAILLATCASAAAAHTKLASSVPAADTVVDRAVTELVLEFAEAVRLTAVTVTDTAGTQLALGAWSKEPGERFAIALPSPLEAGAYVIAWRAVGADTHLVSGDIPFEVTGAGQPR